MLTIAGNSCGVSPTASAKEKRKDSNTGRAKYTFMANGRDGSSRGTNAAAVSSNKRGHSMKSQYFLAAVALLSILSLTYAINTGRQMRNIY